MKLIELSEPDPRDKIVGWNEFEYRVARTVLLNPPDPTLAVNVFNVLDQRRTRRDFQRLEYAQVSSVLWFSAKRRSAVTRRHQYTWQHAPAPSAGGCHPADILILGISGEEQAVFVYEPISHALREVSCPNEEARDRLDGIATELSRSTGCGTTFWFGSQPDRTASRYKNPESLIWRDSGALLATVAIAAEALSLNCCPLGASGDPWVGQLVNSGGLVVGTGGCVVGVRRPV